MSREIFDTYNQEDYTYHAADDSINSETMEKKDPAINQHEEDSRGIHSDTDDSSERNTTNNTSPNIKDDSDDEWDNDADRRTLDEEKADEDEDEDRDEIE